MRAAETGPGRTVVVLLAVALLLRIGFVAATTEYSPQYDAADYDLHAAHIAEHGEYPPTAQAAPGSPSAFRPPAWPHFLAGVYELTGQRWTAARLAGALLGTVSVLLLFLVGKAAFGRRVGLAVGWLAAVFPPFVFLSGALIAENLFVPLVLGAIWAALRYRASPAPGWAVAAGAACGLAALTRTNGLVVLIPVVIALLPPRGAAAGVRGLAAPALAVAAAALAIAPWTIRNAVAFGELVPVSTQSGYTLAGAWNPVSAADGPTQAATRIPREVPSLSDVFSRPGVEETELDEELRSRALEFARDRPLYLLEALRLNTLRMLGLAGDPSFTDAWNAERDMTAWRRAASGAALLAVLVLVAVALVCTQGRRRLRTAPWWLWLAPVLLYASTAPLLGNPRYRLALDPFLLLAAGVALGGLLGRALSDPGDRD